MKQLGVTVAVAVRVAVTIAIRVIVTVAVLLIAVATDSETSTSPLLGSVSPYQPVSASLEDTPLDTPGPMRRAYTTLVATKDIFWFWKETSTLL